MNQYRFLAAITGILLLECFFSTCSLAQKPLTVVAGSESPSLCKADTFTACIGEVGRYRIGIKWDDFSDTKDIQAFVHSVTADSAIFKWSSAGALEVLLAVNDACALNRNFWVFAAPKTTVAFRLSVVDTWSGTTRLYQNQAGNAAIALADTAAFATCSVPPPDLDGDSFPATTDRCPEIAGEDRGCSADQLVGYMDIFERQASGSANLFANDAGIAGVARIDRIGLLFTDLLGPCVGPAGPGGGSECGPDIWLPLEQSRTLEYAGGRVTIEPDGDISWDLTQDLFPRTIYIWYYFNDARGERSGSAAVIALDRF